MKTQSDAQAPCAHCGKLLSKRTLVSASAIGEGVSALILRDHENWSNDSYLCRPDLNIYRSKYVHEMLQSEKGEVSSIENEIVASLRDHELLSKNVESTIEKDWTFGERLADKIAAFGGSWMFLMSFGLFLVIWIVTNSLLLRSATFDPYPYILLNLILSCIAAIQAPIIMMSQNRQEAKDRIRSQHDYQVNLKAELEIRHLHEKIDHLLSHQWDRLAQIQEVQLELLSEISSERRR